MSTPPVPAPPPTTRRARNRLRRQAQERREMKAARRKYLLEEIASGLGYEEVAANRGLSVATVRREVDRALADRREGSAQRYIALQLARLQKAMGAVFDALDGGDMRAAVAMATLLPQFDRYHALASLAQARDGLDAALLHPNRPLQKTSSKALESLAPATEIHAPAAAALTDIP